MLSTHLIFFFLNNGAGGGGGGSTGSAPSVLYGEGLVGYLTPYAYEKLSLSGATIYTFTPAKLAPATGPARLVSFSVEGATVKFRLDGGNPSTSLGHSLPTGSYFTLANYQTMVGFKVTEADGTSTSTIHVTYWR